MYICFIIKWVFYILYSNNNDTNYNVVNKNNSNTNNIYIFYHYDVLLLQLVV